MKTRLTNSNQPNDTWLTPPALLNALGPFDLDPCAADTMPWATAAKMIAPPNDGLAASWAGRVWVNPPYSDPLPWVHKFLAHGDGLMLVPARSPETKWGQAILTGATGVLFLKGRLLFHYTDGSQSKGKWLPNMLVAAGIDNFKCLQHISKTLFPGVVMQTAASSLVRLKQSAET